MPGRRVDLRDLIGDALHDTIVMPDGKELRLPVLGIRQMAQLLQFEQQLADAQSFDVLVDTGDRVLGYLREANPGEEVDYDLTLGQLLTLIGALAGSEDTVASEVREVVSGPAEDGEEPKTVEEAAAELREAAGRPDDDDEDSAPLASPKPSRTRSSRSASSGNGSRSGSTTAAGQSSKRTSKKPAASRAG